MPPGCAPNSPGNPRVSPWGRTKLPKSSMVPAGEGFTFSRRLPPTCDPQLPPGVRAEPPSSLSSRRRRRRIGYFGIFRLDELFKASLRLPAACQTSRKTG